MGDVDQLTETDGTVAAQALIPRFHTYRFMAFALRNVAVETVYGLIARCPPLLDGVEYICPGAAVTDSAIEQLVCHVFGHNVCHMALCAVLETIRWQRGLVMYRFVQAGICAVTGRAILWLIVWCAAVGNGILDDNRIEGCCFTGVTGGTGPAAVKMLCHDISGMTLETIGGIC